MTHIGKREQDRQARLAQIQERLAAQGGDPAADASAGSPAQPTQTSDLPRPAPHVDGHAVHDDPVTRRAQGAGVSKIVSNLQGGLARQFDEVNAQLQEATAELVELRPLKKLMDGRALPVTEIDPNLVRPTSFLNRDKKSLDPETDRDFKAFVADIERKGGNEIPGFIRPLKVADGAYTHEAVYGHRRLQACLLSGKPFKAIEADISDEQAILLQQTENSLRKKLSAIESGRQIASYLVRFRDGGTGRLHDGALQMMASALKSDAKHVAKLALIGSIPDDVLGAIPDIRDIPYRPAYLLARACRDDLKSVMTRIKSLPEDAGSRRTVMHLIGSESPASKVNAGSYSLALPGDPDVREAFVDAIRDIEKRFGVKLSLKAEQ